MAETSIVLSTVTGRYTHTAFGLRWLLANLGPLRERATLREFHLQHPPMEIAERLLAENPAILGLGVYIWNVSVITQVAQAIKGVRPDIVLVLGGPEISHEYENTPLYDAADYIVCGEGEIAFRQLCEAILEGRPPAQKMIQAERLDVTQLHLPYDAYTEDDVTRRLVYVEASRGCPFRCEFCLSSLDPQVRDFPLEPFLDALKTLLARGVRNLLFVDRTFNLKTDRADAILRFLLEHWREGVRVHFEIVPDRLNEVLLRRMAEFPPEGLHLEVGVQTFTPLVLENISRRQDKQKTLETIRFLREQTGVLLHADLVAGLPGESWETFAASFDQLLALRPHEIQVGILKRLKGAPIARHIPEHRMVFSAQAPYEILQTDRLEFSQMQRIKRFARYFDLFYNSGNFPASLPRLFQSRPSAFDAFMAFSDHLWNTTGRTHEFPLAQLARHLHGFLILSGTDSPAVLAETIKNDFHHLPGRKDKLSFLNNTGSG